MTYPSMLTFLRHDPTGHSLSRIVLFSTVLLALAALSACSGDRSSSISALEQRKAEINAELPTLAYLSLNSGVSSIGFRSHHYLDPPIHNEWVEIDLGEPVTLDEIILVPTIWRGAHGNFQADAFPAAFTITARESSSSPASIIADYPDTSELLPRIAPLVIPIASKDKFSSFRIEASRLNRRAFNNDYILQFAEVLAFSKGRNVALRQRVRSSPRPYLDGASAWQTSNLVDGMTPYIMNAASGKQSLPHVSAPLGTQIPHIPLDLGEPVIVSGIRIHTVEQGDTMPQSFPGDFGVPSHFVLEGSVDAAFSKPETLLEVRLPTIYQIGPILEWPISGSPKTKHRYLRLSAPSPYIEKKASSDILRIGFAEIEILSKLSGNTNIARGKEVQMNFGPAAPQLSPATLTDGRNFYGNILPIQQWLKELARRHELEIELASLTLALEEKYQQQETNVRRLLWALAALVVTIGFIMLYERLRRIRQETLIRERIAANLHDELGANLHAIGKLGELAQDSMDDPEHLNDAVQRIRDLTRRTGTAAKDCSHMLLKQELCDDLAAEIKRESSRLLADLVHQLSITGEDKLPLIPRRSRIDLLLFYKECLINILRHSGATTVQTKLDASISKSMLRTRTQLTLEVTDNGTGLHGHTPSALKRRAKLLKGTLEITAPENGGSRIRLTLRPFKFPFG